MFKNFFRRLAILVNILILICISFKDIYARKVPVKSKTAVTDSISPFVHDGDSVLRNIMEEQAKETANIKQAAIADTLIPYVINKVGRYNIILHKSSAMLQRTPNYNSIKDALAPIEKGIILMQKILTDPKKKLNLRSINSANILLSENLKIAQAQSKDIEAFSQLLDSNSLQLKKILYDPIWDIDSLTPDLQKQLKDLHEEATLLAKQDQINNTQVNYYRNKTALLILQLNDVINDLHLLEMNENAHMYWQDAPFLWKLNTKGAYTQTLGQNIGEAIDRLFIITNVYIKKKTGVFIFSLILLGILEWFVVATNKKLKKEPDYIEIKQNLVFNRHYPWLAMLVVWALLLPFLFYDPPSSLWHLAELVRFIAITVVLLPIMNKKGKLFFLSILSMWFFCTIDDQLLNSSLGERIMMLLLQIAMIGLFCYAYINRKTFFQNMLLPKFMGFANVLGAFFAILSLITNFLGRFTVSKIFAQGAIQIVTYAFSINVLVKIILEFVFINAETFKTSKLTAFINYKQLQQKYQWWVVLLGMGAWVLNTFHSLFLYDIFLFSIKILFSKPIHIGSFSFDLYSVFVFFLVIWVAALVSRFVKFVLSSKVEEAQNTRSKLGSMALIIRLGILIVGFLIAIGAAGIPIDRIAIIIGGLGVGIGFGLQNIVNNLVSGIIIAFERPIQVGDQIEVGSKTGLVKEIGVRASKLHNSDGADIIIPNGDLLSGQLINWTLSNRLKRLNFSIHIAYGTDGEKVKEIINETFEQLDFILKSPAPSVNVSQFANGSIHFSLYFWVADALQAPGLKGHVMFAVYEALRKNNIEMPIDSSVVDDPD